MSTLVSRDYRGALDLLRTAHEADGATPFPPHVLAALRRLIPSSIAAYREWDRRSGAHDHWVSGVAPSEAEPIWARYPEVRHQDPVPGVCHGGVVSVPPGRAVRLSDLVSLAQLRRLDLYHEVCRPLGTSHVMKLFLPVRGRSAGFVLESGRRDFTRRDRDLLELLAPHLTLLRRRADAESCAAIAPEAVVELTARERTVVRLVADGMTNREIAAALFVAPGTVRKHLDNVYRKLGVRSRAEAVAVTSARSDAER